jgi:hypothetical protein
MSTLKDLSTLERNELKVNLQSITSEAVEDLSAKEVKEHIHTAIQILLLERGFTGYTVEEAAFYTILRFKTLTEGKTSGFIQTQVKNVEKTSPLVTTTVTRLFNKDQKKFVAKMR